MSHASFTREVHRQAIRRRTLIRHGMISGAGLAAAFAAAACGPSSSKNGSPSAPQGGSAPQAAAQSGQPKRGGTIVAPMPKEPTNYDPHLQVDSSKVGFHNLTLNGIVRFKTTGVTDFQSLEVEPDLLAAMPEQPDKTTLVLKVRPGAKWQNLPPVSGRTVDAEDVKFNIERMKLAKQADGGINERAWIQAEVDSVQVIDAGAVQVKFKRPFPLWTTFMATGYQKLIAREVQTPTTQMVGTGPFIMTQHDRDAQAVFKRNPDYFKQGLPYIDEFIWRADTAEARRIAGLKTGDYAFESVEPTDFDDVRRTNPKLVEHKYFSVSFASPMGFDLSVKQLEDARVRRAIAIAIDFDGIIKALWDGDGYRQAPIPVGFSRFTAKASDLPYYEYNVEKARALMREAGYDASKPLKVEIETNQAYTDNIKMQPILKEQLREIFVDVTGLPTLPPTEFLGKRNSPGTGWTVRMWSHSTFSDPDEFLFGFYHTTGSRNYGKWGSPEMDAMIEKQRGDVSAEERRRILLDIQKDLADKAWRIGTAAPSVRFLHQPWLKGWTTLAVESGYQALQAENIWIDR